MCGPKIPKKEKKSQKEKPKKKKKKPKKKTLPSQKLSRFLLQRDQKLKEETSGSSDTKTWTPEVCSSFILPL